MDEKIFYMFSVKFDKNNFIQFAGIDKLGVFSFKTLFEYLDNIDILLKFNLSNFHNVGDSQILVFDNGKFQIEYHIALCKPLPIIK